MYHEESQIQIACVRWFYYQHRDLEGLLFAVPNGGRRGKVEAGIMKAEGVYAGVADLLLLVPRGPFHGLAIEMKTAKGRLSDSQKEWAKKVLKQGYEYVVCRSVDDFIEQVEYYLSR